jgi:hypothetical protein
MKNNKLKMKFLLLCVLIICSCSNNNKQSKPVNRAGQKLYTMQELPHKTFNLDENTSQISNYFQVFTIDGIPRFTMYSNTIVRKNILIFDISTGKIVDSVRLHKEGPHAVGNNIQGYYIHNMDSIYLYDYWQYTLLLANRKGEIINKINLSEKLSPQDNSNIIPSYPYPSMEMPIHKINNILILQGASMDLTEMKIEREPILAVTALYNLSDATVKFVNPYPDVYGDMMTLNQHWGIFSYKMVPYDLNNKGEMILSFPADDHITIYDIASNTTRRYFAGYSKNDIIKQKDDTRIGDLLQYLECTQYGNIHFDSYRNLYYRFVYPPFYDYDINNRDTQVKNISIIILDSEFNKIGEYDLKEKPRISKYAFVSKEGLHIQTISDDDDFMKFLTLKPVKL